MTDDRRQMTNPPIPPLLKGGEGGLLNEKGIALVMVLILSVIALAIMAGLIYMITAGTQVSGIQKRYKTAYEAGKGGGDVIYSLIGLRAESASQTLLISSLSSNWGTITTPGGAGTACTGTTMNSISYTGIAAKILTPTSSWSTFCSRSLTIDPNTSTTYDMSFELGPSPPSPQRYRVYAKIVNTIEGNSGGEEGLLKSGVVSASGEVPVQSRPYLYTIEVDAENTTTSAERAKLSILYQY